MMGKGKDSTNRHDKGKGKGKQRNVSKPSPDRNERTDSTPPKKGKSKGKGQDAKNNTLTTAKSKGKGQGQTNKYKLEPEGWNVLPLDTFVPSHGAIYVCEKSSKQKELLNRELERTSPLEFFLPFLWTLESKHLKLFLPNLQSPLGINRIKSPCKHTSIRSHMLTRFIAKLRLPLAYKDLPLRRPLCATSPFLMRVLVRKPFLNFSKDVCQPSNSGLHFAPT